MKEYLPLLVLPFAFLGLTKVVGKTEKECYICSKTTNDYKMFQVDYPGNYQSVCGSCDKPFEDRLIETEGLKKGHPRKKSILPEYDSTTDAQEEKEREALEKGVWEEALTGETEGVKQTSKEDEDELYDTDIEEEMKKEKKPLPKFKGCEIDFWRKCNTDDEPPFLVEGFRDIDAIFTEEPKVVIVSKEEYDQVARTTDDLSPKLSKEVVEHKNMGRWGSGWGFVITDNERTLFIDTQGYSYPRYKGVLRCNGKVLKFEDDKIKTKGTPENEENLFRVDEYIKKFPHISTQRLFKVWQYKDNKWETVKRIPLRNIIPHTGRIDKGTDFPAPYWVKGRTYYTAVGIEL